MSDGEYYVTGKTVRSWLSDVEPKLDSIRRMALTLARGRNWSKARYLSWPRLGDVIRPRFAPRVTYSGISIAEFTPLRVAA